MQSPAAGAGAEESVVALIEGDATAGRFALVVVDVERGAEPPRHRHLNEDQAIYVLAGEVELMVGEERFSGAAGTAVFVPRGVDHGFAVLSEQARLLTAFVPAGFEGFYREMVGVAPDDLDRLIATAARYGCEVTGPPLAATEGMSLRSGGEGGGGGGGTRLLSPVSRLPSND